MDPDMRIGCAGWNLPRESWPRFPVEGSHLERYAQVFNAVEINSSFYKPHRPQTYARWAAAVPADFRFCVKLPKAITHERQLRDCAPLIDAFLGEAGALEARLGCVLVQLPPRLAFDPAVTGAFLGLLRQRHRGPVALEPRHATWFTPEAEALLVDHHVARVLADPVLHAGGERPGGWPGLVYCRLHGSPRTYYSAYRVDTIVALARRLRQAVQKEGAEAWCIFDNTAAGAAVPDALALAAATAVLTAPV